MKDVGEKEEKRLILVPLYEADCLIRKLISQVFRRFHGFVVAHYPGAVALCLVLRLVAVFDSQLIGKIPVTTAEVAVKFIKPSLQRMQRLMRTQVPFSYHTAMVSGSTQRIRDGCLL